MIELPNSLTLSNKRLKLVNGEEANCSEALNVINDPKTMQNLSFLSRKSVGGWDIEALKDRQSRRRSRQSSNSCLFFDVYLKDGDQFVGSCGFPEIDLTHRRGEFGLIIHHSFWRKKIGLECHLLCLDYAFSDLNLNRVEFQTSVNNTPMRKFFEKFGFEFETTKKDFYLEEGRFVDYVIYVLFQKNWDKTKAKMEQQLID